MSQVATKGPQVGEMAPDFSLAGTAETTVTLSNYRGNHNVLMVFYPKDFTSG